MQRIIQQDVDSAELATQVLGWVAFAKRPLTTTEIRHALAIELGSSDLDPDNIPDIADISSVCGGLVTVDEGSNIIRLVHYTTQEYFERTWQSWFPDAHRDITDTLITYLLFDEFGSGSCDKDEEFDARLRTYPFYEYASRHWGNHARSLWNDHLGNAFLQNKSKISSSAQALFVSKWRIWDTNYSQRVPKQTTAMHLTAYFGLTDILNDLVAQGMPCDSLDSFRQTPLFLAAMSGHESVVSLLLERGAKPDSRDYYNRSPLYRAAWNGREAISRVLLGHGADPNPVDRHGGTPLLRAAWSGHDAIVRLLLEKGADANLMNKFGRSALSYAAWAGHDKVVRILLDHGAEPNTQDIEFRQSPLLGAAWHGYLEIVQLLLENGANPEVKDSKLEMTPLEAAVDRGYEEVVKILERSKNGEQNELISN